MKVLKIKLFALQQVSTLSSTQVSTLGLDYQSPACCRSWGAQHQSPFPLWPLATAPTGMKQELLTGEGLHWPWHGLVNQCQALGLLLTGDTHNFLMCTKGRGMNPSISVTSVEKLLQQAPGLYCPSQPNQLCFLQIFITNQS